MPTKPLRACLASFRRPPCSTTSMCRKGASGSNKAASNTSREICPRRNKSWCMRRRRRRWQAVEVGVGVVQGAGERDIAAQVVIEQQQRGAFAFERPERVAPEEGAQAQVEWRV